MTRFQTILILILICCNTFIIVAQNITVDDTYTAQQLVENVLVNSSCAETSNSNATGDNIVPVGKNSYGYFTNAGGSFPFTEGVVLSTSYAQKAIGPFSTNPTNITGNDGDSGWLGDADLNQALGITTTVTATVLEFDFVPLTNFLSFDYIFASIEYHDTGSCHYTDGFAFLIKENSPGSVYDNLAVLPGTRTAVSSTNIRPTIPSGVNSGCPAVNEQYFNGFNNSTSPINYAAQTVVMNAQTAVIAGKSYHIKLVIANDKNEYYDSAVFLKAGSFSPKIDLGPDRLAATNPICYGDTITIDTQLSASYDYKWFKNNIELIGETKPTLSVNDTGTYRVEVTFTPSTCMATDDIRIEYAPKIILSDVTLVQCDDNSDGISVFNLSKIDNLIKNNDATLSPVVYYESLSDAQGITNPIANPAAYQNKTTVPTLFARVSNTFGCVNYAQVNLVIANNNIPFQNPISTCDGDAVQDGLYQFDLNTQVTPQIISSLPAGMVVEYYINTTDAIAQKNVLPTIFKNTVANQQIIQARIVNGPDCYGIIPITLIVNSFNPPNFQNETTSVCLGTSTDLSVATGFSSYLWSTGATNNTISITAAGNYSVTVTDSNGCLATKKFVVTSSGVATITGVSVNDFKGNENSVELQYSGIGNYEFTLDGYYYQEKPIFIGIAPGKYFAYARDKNGCGLSDPYVVYVLDYPRFFTPNGDGYNDSWKIKNLYLFPKATIIIYDRYGKVLQEINAINPSWNGKYNGKELPSDDYWFQINFGDGKLIKGHFALKR
jgi:gliding motility-associated-like protein